MEPALVGGRSIGKNPGPTFVLHRNSDNFRNTVRSKRRVRNFCGMFLGEVDRNCRPLHRKSCLADTAVDFFPQFLAIGDAPRSYIFMDLKFVQLRLLP